MAACFLCLWLIAAAILSGAVEDSEARAEKTPHVTVVGDTSLVQDVSTRRVTVPPSLLGPLTVEFVEIDTAYHGRQLWLSEKVAITPPPYARYASITAVDSRICVAYCVRANPWLVYTVESMDHGQVWLTPDSVQVTGWTTAGLPVVMAQPDNVFLAYSAAPPGEEPRDELLFRAKGLDSGPWSDSTLVDTSFSSSDALFRPCILRSNDTTYLSYYSRADDINSISVKFSVDEGETWALLGDSIPYVTGGGSQYLLRTDTVLSLAYQQSLTAVIHHSYDGGQTWTERRDVSAVGNISQLPAACSNGQSDIHVVWYDMEGSPSGWGGYVFYRFSHDCGDSWSEIRSLSTQPESEEVEVYADSDCVYAAWNDSRYGSPNYAIYLRYSLDRGETWSPEYKVVSEVDPAWEPQIYSDGTNFYMTWREQHPPSWEWQIYCIHGRWYKPGDVDDSGVLDISDLVYMVSWMFDDGPEPALRVTAEIDGEGVVDISDLVYYVDYMFEDGFPPVGGNPGLD